SMNWDRIEGNWKQFRGKVQQQWGELTNDDLDRVEGRRVELVGKIQERYGIAKDEAERQVESWLPNIVSRDQSAAAGSDAATILRQAAAVSPYDPSEFVD